MAKKLAVLAFVVYIGGTCAIAQNRGDRKNAPGFYSGVYRNIFEEAGYKKADIDVKLDKAYRDLFEGPHKIYFEVGDSMAYVSDLKNHDARTEGLSYGMMVAVQLNKKEVFDRIWRWSKRYLQHQDGPRAGYFAWSINPQTMLKNSEGTASDGELYFITDLLFASNRWGNQTGIDYYREARNILDAMWNKDGTDGIYNILNIAHKQITFTPEGDNHNWTDPSYQLPAFFEVWAMYAKDGHEQFYAACADTARAFLHRACNPVTGLNADYTEFSGEPRAGRRFPVAFRYDSWRVPMNISMDYNWFGKDKDWQQGYAGRIQHFLLSKGIDSFKDQFNVDGSTPDFILQAGGFSKLRHSLGLVASAAATTLINTNNFVFVRALWNAKLEPYPDDYFDPYYDGLLYLFSIMHLSGKYQLIRPAVRPDTMSYYNSVGTFVNPVLPGDHPDPTLLKVGDDFYHCGSSFHFTPYLPVYHSRDLVHWEVISRVVSPSVGAAFVADRPSGGIWQGGITWFYGSYWIYFSSEGQWFCKAASPYGPWSAPVQVKTNPATGPLGYDNSIFVDDDGKPYMVIKNGQKVNRLQALGRDGQLTDTVINLDWINARLQYSWAEGPVMCKRNGYYYYFPAGDVSGGQYVLRTRKLTADSTYWERLGDFFKPVTDPYEGLRRPNHISAPLQLADGSWWTIGQSYEKYDNDDWSGTGRQTSLYPVIWEGDRPWGMAPTTQPIVRPDLPQSGILWTSMYGDDFDSAVLSLQWHFLSRKAAGSYSLTARKGWLRLTPDTGRAHLVQKETDHYYTAVTKVDLDATDTAARAGIYLTNGNQRVVARLYMGYDGARQIVFRLDTAVRRVPNTAGNVVWLKLQREGHMLTAYYSGDGSGWVSLGAPVSAVDIDKSQPNFNSWVGTSVGLFAEGKAADFDFFTCKDAFSLHTAAGYSNFYGIRTVVEAGNKVVTNTSPNGGWFMISGVETGDRAVSAVELTVAAKAAGKLEIWLDDLQQGTPAATVPVTETGGDDQWKTFSVPVGKFKGHHDVFIKYPAGEAGVIYIRSVRFIK